MAKLEQDFTKGNIGGHLIRFCLPFLAANLLQALYSVVDMLVVGNFSGKAALSGVNIGGQVTHLMVMAVSGLTVGGTVLVAQYYGARRQKDASETIGTMFTLLFGLAIVATVLMIALCEPMLHSLNTPLESFSEAKAYLNICALGNLFVFGYNAIASVQRAMGDSKRPLIFVGVACALNIFLDLLLVAVFKMGAAGAAWATIASQGVSLLLSAWYLGRNKFIFDFKLSSFKVRADKVRGLIKIGLPSSVQSIVVNLSFLLMTGLVNGFGVDASAAVGIAGKFNSFAILPAVAMSQSVSSMAAQNIGAGFFDRAKKVLWHGVEIALLLGAAVFVVAQLFPEAILRIFIDDMDAANLAVIQMGVQYMRTFSFDYLLVPVVFCLNGLLTGAGHTNISLVNGALSSIILRIPVAYFLSKTALGLAGVGLAAPAASLASTIFALWFVLSGRWMHNTTGIAREPDDQKEIVQAADSPSQKVKMQE